jgi:hypothetical protein
MTKTKTPMAKAMGAVTAVQDILAIRAGATAGYPPGPTMTALQSLGRGWGMENIGCVADMVKASGGRM